MIPRILHRVCSREVPARYAYYWHRWGQLHPAWELRTWWLDPWPADDPPFELSEKIEPWLAMGWPGFGSGQLRYEVLLRYGGVFTDWDVEPLRPLDELCSHPAFIGKEDGDALCDALMGCEPGHAGFRHAVDLALNANMGLQPHIYGGYHGIAGPALERRADVSLLASRAFYPYHYSEPSREGEDWHALSPESFAVHHWAHSWSGLHERATEFQKEQR